MAIRGEKPFGPLDYIYVHAASNDAYEVLEHKVIDYQTKIGDIVTTLRTIAPLWQEC